MAEETTEGDHTGAEPSKSSESTPGRAAFWFGMIIIGLLLCTPIIGLVQYTDANNQTSTAVCLPPVLGDQYVTGDPPPYASNWFRAECADSQSRRVSWALLVAIPTILMGATASRHLDHRKESTRH